MPWRCAAARPPIVDTATLCSNSVASGLVRTVRPQAEREEPAANLIDYDSARTAAVVTQRGLAVEAGDHLTWMVSTGNC